MTRTILLLWCMIGVGCAGPSLTPEAQHYRGWVTELASPAMEGRGPGTAGIERARDLLAETFENLGLRPGFASGSYLQPFEIPLETKATRAELAWSKDEKTHDLKHGPAYDFSVFGLSGDGAFDGEAVFVGYALDAPERSYDDSKAQTDLVRGRVAIALRYEPMDKKGKSRWGEDGRWTEHAFFESKAKWAQAHGATALLIVNPPRKETGGVLPSTQHTVVDVDVTIPVIQVRDRVIEKIVGERTLRAWQNTANERSVVELLPGVRFTGAATIEHNHTIIHNVCAALPGAGALKDETIVVGAHYDHLGYGEVGSMTNEHAIHPGADDNASGTAAVMMLAERWANRLQRTSDAERRTLVFMCFSGEERGTLGSMYLTEHPDELAFDLKRTAAMVNFDMVGRMESRRLTVMNAGSGDLWQAYLARAGEGLGLDVNVSVPMSGRTDHVHFHKLGVATVHLFTGLHEDYHSPTDTADRINARGGAKVVDFADALLEQLVTGPAIRFIPEPEGGYTAPP